jgi:hypothetical protein
MAAMNSETTAPIKDNLAAERMRERAKRAFEAFVNDPRVAEVHRVMFYDHAALQALMDAMTDALRSDRERAAEIVKDESRHGRAEMTYEILNGR